VIKKFFNSQSKTITSAAILLGATSLASRILGVFRERILAGRFGAGDELDIYFAAFRVPDLIYNLLVIGALTAGFIPVFTSYWNEEKNNHREAWQLASNVLNILGLALIVICGIAAIFARKIIPLITPGFNPEKINLTINMARLIFLSPIFLGISGVLSGVLQSFKNFMTFALAPILYNLGIIFGAVFLVDCWGLYGLAAGVLIGAFLHMLIQIPPVVMAGFRYKISFDFFHSGVRKIGRLMVPRTLSLGIAQLNFVAMTFIASTLAAGSIAVFYLAYNIYALPFGIIAVSYSVAAFPSLTESAVKKQWKEFAKNFSSSFRQILFFIIPAAVFLIILRAQLVRVILGAGQFDWQDTILTARCLAYLSLGLLADSAVMLLIRGFFAIENTIIPAITTLAGTFVRLLAAFLLAKTLGIGGLALGYSLGGFLSMIILWILLEGKIKELDSSEIIFAGVKILVSAVFAGLVAYGVLNLTAPLVNMQTFLGIFTQGLFAGLAGIVAYVVAGLILKSQEMFSFWQAITHRLPWIKVAPKEEIIE